MSSINTNNIDKQFPQPGVDNDSFGFRNNFSEIADNFDLAKQEIEDLQNNVLRSDRTNDLNNNILTDLNLKNATQAVFDLGNVADDVQIDVTNGSYQKITAASNLSISAIGWPNEDKSLSILLELSKSSSEDIIISFSTLADQTFRYDANFPETLILTNESQSVFIELSCADNGETIFAKYVGAYTPEFDAQLENPFTTRNLVTTKNAVINGDLTVNGTINFPDLEIPAGLDALQDVEIDSGVSNNQILRYNSSTNLWNNVDDPLSNTQVQFPQDNQLLRYNATENAWQNVDDPLSNVDIDSGLSNKQILRYNTETNLWENVDDPLDNVSLENLQDNQLLQYVAVDDQWKNIDAPLLSKTDISNPTDGEILRYNINTDRWENRTFDFDVDTQNLSDKQILRFNNTTNIWEPKNFARLVDISVTISTNTGTGNSEFRLDGQFLEAADFFFQVGTIYKFDLSDSSNATASLKFSTTPDTSVPSSITDYTQSVTTEGTPGEPGAYIEIEITEDTPNTLYLYGTNDNALIDTSLLGKGTDGAIDVGVRRQKGVFQQVKSDIVVENGDTVIDFQNSVVQGKQTPDEFIIPVVTTAERDQLGGNSGVPFIGQLVFNTDESPNGAPQVYIGSGIGWQTLAYV